MICPVLGYIVFGLVLAVYFQRVDPVAPGDESLLAIVVFAWGPVLAIAALTWPTWWMGRYIARLAAAL